MTENEFVQLLYRGESESLDFKNEQYVFVGASEEAKAELLKDILAFTNAWRNDPAYILIGVQETPSRRANATGISPADHIDDATLQQFVNGKTNRPVRFAYEKFDHDGRQIGIITVSGCMGRRTSCRSRCDSPGVIAPVAHPGRCVRADRGPPRGGRARDRPGVRAGPAPYPVNVRDDLARTAAVPHRSRGYGLVG